MKFIVLLILLLNVALADSVCRPVILKGEELFCIKQSLGSYSPQERSDTIVHRLEKILPSWNPSKDRIHVTSQDKIVYLGHEDTIIVGFADGDIDISEHETLLERSTAIADHMERVLNDHAPIRDPKEIIKRIVFGVCSFIGLFLSLFVLGKLFPFLSSFIQDKHFKYLKGIKIQKFEVFSERKINQLIHFVFTTTRWAISLLLVYFFLSFILSLIPQTEDLAPKLLSHIINPFMMIGEFVIDFIPKLFFIIVILMVTRYSLKFVHFLFNEVEKGNITFKDFHPEWAEPTYKIVRILMIALGFIVVFPYLPGSSSPAFKGVTVFLGVLFSIGSSPAIGNAVAGIVITYMRPFRVGDRVKIANTEGDVIEKNLLVTRIRTERNEDITVPNSMVLSSHIINFNTTAKEGLVIQAEATIAYDIPWEKVHELMIKAAYKTKGILNSPSPYVLHKTLHDFYVVYEIYATTDNPNMKYMTQSLLNQSIQDVFADAGVALLSPHYRAHITK